MPGDRLRIDLACLEPISMIRVFWGIDMQLIEKGPDIPERLLQAHEEGHVVFFCGAGISYPAGLPGFHTLVTRIRDELGLVFSGPVAAAFKHGQYDATIGLIERDLNNGREVIRRKVAEILTPNLDLPNATATHEALLTLSRTGDQRQRLITTNFDRMFETVRHAEELAFPTFEAPLLPVPKKRWDGVVYLHGLLPERPTAGDLNKLVLSSGDFGLAYLTERWASRFVGELFRSHVVCFVGYSINDPVLRYMMDALAADRLLGEAPPEVFAFGSYIKSENGRAAADAEWRAKSVTPILYREYKRHHYLHETLRRWGKLYRDGVLGTESIVSRYAAIKPVSSTEEDDFVGRMLWALSHRSGLPAKRFAEFEPLPSLDWLEPMMKERYGHTDLDRFGVRAEEKEDKELAFTLLSRPSPYRLAARMRPVGHSGQAEGRLDPSMEWLGHWLARHADNPALLHWVVGHGPRLHSAFVWRIERALERGGIRPEMVRLWRLVLSGRLHDGTRFHDLFGWAERLGKEGYSAGLRMELVRLLAPRVQLRRPLRLGAQAPDGEARADARVRDLVSWEIMLGNDFSRDALERLAEREAWRTTLREMLPHLTGLLRDVLDLMRELDGATDLSDLSYVAQPSITPHEQNRGFRDWTYLIDLARDAWSATAEVSPALARGELQRWLSLPYPLFRRLAFFAATHRNILAPSEALEILLEAPLWLWSTETQREAIRLLVSIAPDLSEAEATRLQDVILEGPDRQMFRDDAAPEQVERAVDREIWLRLLRLRDAGASLTLAAQARLAQNEARYPLWRLAEGDRNDFPFWMGDGADWGTFTQTPVDLRELIDWLRANPETRDFDKDDWQERCQKSFPRAATALLVLAREGHWPLGRWRTELQVWSEAPLLTLSWRWFARLLAEAPDAFVVGGSDQIAWWLEMQAKSFAGREAAFLQLVDRLLWLHREDESEMRDDIVGQAINHPIGHAVQALFSWWYRGKLRDGQGLAPEIAGRIGQIGDTAVRSFRLGRVLLGANVIALYRVDPDWTRRHVLPLFDWNRSAEEPPAIWKGFLWSPRLHAPLIAEIKAQFLATAQHATALAVHGEQYASLLTYVGLEAAEMMTRIEMRAALVSLGEEGLARVARTLAEATEGAGEQRSDYWSNRVWPFIERNWPRDAALRTREISEQFARICVASGAAFPEAFERLRDWLQPSAGQDMLPYRLSESGLCATHPETALALLSTVISDDAQWAPHKLRDCLDQIRQADGALPVDPRYQRLDQLLRRHGRD